MKLPILLTTCVATAALSFPAWAGTPSEHSQLQAIATNATFTSRDAGKMWSYSSDQLDWMAQGGQLMRLRSDINTLGREVHRLQSENALPPAQQRMVARVAQRVNLMAVATQEAILFGRTHRQDFRQGRNLFNPMYVRDVNQIYSNAEHLNHDAWTALNFANIG